MQNRMMLILNGVVALATAVFLFSTLAPPTASPAASQIEQIPGPAA
ncbi:MAG: hypothetical protein GY943_32000 [Chloroflexi bacterium]|nr:hypothetical protein [Chloroflexota bacterium]